MDIRPVEKIVLIGLLAYNMYQIAVCPCEDGPVSCKWKEYVIVSAVPLTYIVFYNMMLEPKDY